MTQKKLKPQKGPWGGQREGSGRKHGIPNQSVSTHIPVNLLNRIRERARGKNQSVSTWIREALTRALV